MFELYLPYEFKQILVLSILILMNGAFIYMIIKWNKLEKIRKEIEERNK